MNHRYVVMTEREIAERLGVDKSTVHEQLGNALRKLEEQERLAAFAELVLNRHDPERLAELRAPQYTRCSSIECNSEE